MNRLRHQQKAIVFVSLLLFALVLVVVQLWLFVSALEQVLDGHTAMAIPAMIASIVCLGINVWMLRGVYSMDK